MTPCTLILSQQVELVGNVFLLDQKQSIKIFTINDGTGTLEAWQWNVSPDNNTGDMENAIW